MNKKRIRQCIDMLNAIDERHFSMTRFQKVTGANCVQWDMEHFHACGNSACFAGYLALSDFFRNDGGDIDIDSGAPVFENQMGSLAVSKYLGISTLASLLLVNGDVDELYNEGQDRWRCYSNYYEKEWQDVTPKDVVKKLEGILQRG